RGKYYPVDFDLVDFKSVFTAWDKKLNEHNGWGSIFLGNHDFSRMVSRFGNDSAYRVASAKLLAALLLTLRGTVYIYQGDEIGMTNVAFSSIEDYDDVETRNAWKEAEANGENMAEFLKMVHRQSRDNARTPMQWNSKPHAGFTQAQPWIGVNDNFKEINVTSQEQDTDSILNFYRKMIAFRKAHPILVYGHYEVLDSLHPRIYAYRRWDENEEFLMVHNFSDSSTHWEHPMTWEVFEVVHSNQHSANDKNEFLPWQSKIFKRSDLG
ncbi:MAG: alpha-amylase family glycosyl hydrolase, partial [Bacteroidota bacterium]